MTTKTSRTLRKTSVVIMLLSISLIALHRQYSSIGAPSSWTINPGFIYRGVTGGGNVSYQSPVTVYGWYWSGNYVRFQNLVLGTRTWSDIGLNCSSNANMTLATSTDKVFKYVVSAPALSTSVTQISFPSGTNIKDVVGCTSWSKIGSNVEINTIHTSPATITVWFVGVGLDTAIVNVKNTWGTMFYLIIIMISIGFVIAIMEDREVNILETVVALAVFTGFLFLILQFLERFI